MIIVLFLGAVTALFAVAVVCEAHHPVALRLAGLLTWAALLFVVGAVFVSMPQQPPAPPSPSTVGLKWTEGTRPAGFKWAESTSQTNGALTFMLAGDDWAAPAMRITEEDEVFVHGDSVGVVPGLHVLMYQSCIQGGQWP